MTIADGWTGAPLAVALGDPAGIGPEIVVKAWLSREREALAPFFAVGDIRSIDDYKFEFNPVAASDGVCGGRAKVPNINNMPIDKARAALKANGWEPVPSSEQDRTDSRVAELVKLGVIEAEACSGTGLGYCSYNYRGEAGTLSVTTAGDNDYPSVSDYDVKCN